MELDAALSLLEGSLGLVGLAATASAYVQRRLPGARTRRRALGLGAFAAFGLVEWSKRVEPSWTEVTHVEVKVTDAPFRAVLLSDFHAGRASRSDIERAVALTNDASPDVILLAGDYISGYELTQERRAALEGLRGLRARRGVLAVMGNHDSEPYGDDVPRRGAVSDVLRGFGYRVLANEAVDLGSFWLVGLEDVQAGLTDTRAAFASVPAGARVVVLAHDWHALPEAPMALGLVGHTHGGQVCVPFTSLCAGPPRDRPFVRGEHVWPFGGRLYVTRGLGLAKVPARLGCRPEVTVLELGPRDPAERGDSP